MKIRVLHIIHTLHLGGAESNLYNLVSFHDLSTVEPHVAYASGGPFEQKLREKGARLFKYASKPTKIKSLATFSIIWKLFSYIKKHQIQIVHTHNYNAHVWGSVAAKLAGVKLLEHVHDPRYEPPGYMASLGLPETTQFAQVRYFSKLSDKIFVLTNQNKEYIVSQRMAPVEKVSILWNGIPLSENIEPKSSVFENLSIPPEGKIVFTAMRLSPEKNAAAILEIARRVRNPNVFFVIAGNGPEKKILEEKARKARIAEKIHFLGYRSDIKALLSASDIFILPTLRELHSLTMMEAMSLGIPALVSKGAGCNDDFIRHGENGFLLDPRNPAEWAETIDLLLQNDDQRQKVGHAGKEWIKQECDIKIVVRKIESIYSQLVKKTA